jgi:hypothetical protein
MNFDTKFVGRKSKPLIFSRLFEMAFFCPITQGQHSNKFMALQLAPTFHVNLKVVAYLAENGFDW